MAEPLALARFWREAARETSWRLLLGAARERLLDSARSSDCLRVGSGADVIAIPLARSGAFELDTPTLDGVDDPRLDDPLAILAWIVAHEQVPARDRERLRAEIVDSTANLALARLARVMRHELARASALDLGDPRADPRLVDPEHFVTDGHPWHPMTRTRLGLTRAAVMRHAGELLAETRVACVDVEQSHAQVAGEYLDEARGWFGSPPPGFVRLPVHPAQLGRLRQLFAPLWTSGVIRLVERPPVIGRSLLSLRTLALTPDRHLKLALDVHTTSTRRWVSPMSVHNGPKLTRLLLDIQARDPITAPLRLLAEPSAAGLAPERVGPLAGQLGAIFRVGPGGPTNQAVWVCAAIGERWPGTDELTLDRAAIGYPGGRRERIAALIDDWIAALVPAALRLFARYGIALELHLQNTLVRVVDGRIAGFCVRDLGGIRIHAPRLAAAKLPAIPSFASASFIITDDLDEVRGKLEHTLFHAHLAHLFTVAATLGVDEASSWARLRSCIERCLTEWSKDPMIEAHARAEFSDELRSLTRPEVRAKALLRMRLSERSSEYEYTRVANALARS